MPTGNLVDVLNLYADDSGARKPDLRHGNQSRERDWFGLGGFLIAEADKTAVKERHAAFVAKWPQISDVPLHSARIRNFSDGFRWLRGHPRAAEFHRELGELICTSPIVCIATVIDRPGYMTRYEQVYTPDQRWSLCKTAFCILIERAAKYAADRGQRLRVNIEASDKKTDAMVRGYYEALRRSGMPFNPNAMATYAPLQGTDLGSTLYEFRTKRKTSRLMQLADLCLYPICRYPYDPAYLPHRHLVESGRLMDSQLPAALVPSRGIKYSCFEQWGTPGAIPSSRPSTS